MIQKIWLKSWLDLTWPSINLTGQQLVWQQADPLQEEQHQGAGRGKHVRRQGGGGGSGQPGGWGIHGRRTVPWGFLVPGGVEITGWSIWSRNTVCWHQFNGSATLWTSYTKAQILFQFPQKVVLDQMDHHVQGEILQKAFCREEHFLRNWFVFLPARWRLLVKKLFW